MDLDTSKIDEAILGLLYLTLHDQVRAWKSMDWAAMGRLHEKGLIHDPVNKAKSVAFTDAGLREAERIFTEQFENHSHAPELVQYGNATVEARSAEGVSGFLCRNASDGSAFFRVYGADGAFTDYALRHDGLRVTIAADAMASFYHVGDEPVLDHSPKVLGLRQADEIRAPAAASIRSAAAQRTT